MNYSKVLQPNIFFKHLKNKFSLTHIDIELTERCNNACIHCYINQPQYEEKIARREMNTSFVMEVLQQAANLGCMTVRFTGGEPLLREDFNEIYPFARRLGLFIVLSTNATLITEDLCKLFAEIPPGRPLQVTIYGMHPWSYDAVVARKGAFVEYQNGINFLMDYNIPFEVRQSLLPQNRNEISEFERFSETLPFMAHEPGYTMNFDLRARRDNSLKNHIIKQLRYTPEETLAVLSQHVDKFVTNSRAFMKNHLTPIGENLFSCNAGLVSCTVDAYGSAQMCILLRHPKTVYNLDPDQHKKLHPTSDCSPLEYAVKNFFPQIREMVSHNPEYLRRCGNCFLRGFCDQCPAKSWSEHGTLDTPVEYFCLIAHEKARYLDILKGGEHAWEVVNWKSRIEDFVNEKQTGPNHITNLV